MKGHDRNVRCIAYSPNGLTLATGGEDRTVRLWGPLTGNQRAILQGHKGTCFGLAFSPDGKYLASASYDSTVRIFSADCEELLDRHEVRDLLSKYLKDNENEKLRAESTSRLAEGEPDQEDFEGYTGNAGMTLERWYHRAAIVLPSCSGQPLRDLTYSAKAV